MQSARYLFGGQVATYRHPEDTVEPDGGVMKRFADPPTSPLEVATGKVTDACYPRHTHAELETSRESIPWRLRFPSTSTGLTVRAELHKAK